LLTGTGDGLGRPGALTSPAGLGLRLTGRLRLRLHSATSGWAVTALSHGALNTALQEPARGGQ
jgi:hypothetical protein